MSRKLYVGNLPYQTDERELQELFGQFGSIDSVRVMRDMATGRARGFAFVEMATGEEAQAAAANGGRWPKRYVPAEISSLKPTGLSPSEFDSSCLASRPDSCDGVVILKPAFIRSR